MTSLNLKTGAKVGDIDLGQAEGWKLIDPAFIHELYLLRKINMVYYGHHKNSGNT